MKILFKMILGVSLVYAPQIASAQIRPVTRVPMCLQYPDTKSYIPCTGVVPVDMTTGEPMSWAQAMAGGGDSSGPSTTPNGTVRRSHWTETQTPLGPNAKFEGALHDDDSPNAGGVSRWGSFSCFAWADQAATLEVQTSINGTDWVTIQSRNWEANVSLYLIQPIFTKYSRCKVTNGSTAQSAFILYSAFGI